MRISGSANIYRYLAANPFLLFCIAGVLSIVVSSIILDTYGLPFVSYGFAREAELAQYAKLALNVLVFVALGLVATRLDVSKRGYPHIQRSTHQVFIDGLYLSGLSAYEMNAAWNDYYDNLSNQEKHLVWHDYNQYRSQESL